MTEGLLERAVASLKQKMEDEYNLGKDEALNRIADGDISLSEVEEISDKGAASDYASIRFLSPKYIDQSDSYLDGFSDGCIEVLRQISSES